MRKIIYLLIYFYSLNLSAQNVIDSTFTSPKKLRLINDPLTPSKAAFYSAVIPGLGQIYTRRYWMIPIVYGGLGKAARNWECYNSILESLKELGNDETLLIQSGKPVGVFKTHVSSPRVLISNSMIVPNWANWDYFNELDKKGLMMYGQMTAGSWIYIGTQGILQGTYETLAEVARQKFNSTLKSVGAFLSF